MEVEMTLTKDFRCLKIRKARSDHPFRNPCVTVYLPPAGHP